MGLIPPSKMVKGGALKGEGRAKVAKEGGGEEGHESLPK